MSKNEMVSVPRELLSLYLGEGEGDWVEAGYQLRYLLAQPAEQPQGEPVAYQFRERPCWDKPQGWSNWQPCDKGYRDNLKAVPLLHDWEYETRALFTHADPGEVEQAKAAHRKHAAELIASRTLLREELDTLRAQLAEQDDPCKWTDRQVLDFLGVALRNVDLKGEVRMSEIRQGFQYMRDRAALARKS